MSEQESDKRAWVRSLGLFGVIVSDLVGYPGLALGLGYYAWKNWGAPEWVLLPAGLVGLAVAFYKIYQTTLRLK